MSDHPAKYRGWSSPKYFDQWYGKRVDIYLPDGTLFGGGIITALGWSWGARRHQVGFGESCSLRELPCEWWKVRIVPQKQNTVIKAKDA